MIILISPEYNFPIWSEMYPNGALATLKAVAQKEHVGVYSIQMVADKFTLEMLLERIPILEPEYIGITFTTFQTKSVKEICRAIKERWEIPIIAGGAHVSSIGASIVEDFPDIDIFVAGEGETIFRDILRGGYKSYKSRVYIKCNQFEKLDELPMPDYSFENLDKYTGAPPPSARPSMFMMASRGCPSQCTFCNKAVYGSHVRYKSPERVIKELRQLHDMGAKEVFFQDDTLNLNYEWLNEILDRIQSEKFGMVYRAPFRANEKLISYSLLKKLRDTGFWLIFYGVESGDEQILKSVKKGLTIPEIERAFRLTQEAGIKTEASFIVGLPGETHQTVKKSWELYKRLKPFWAGFSAAVPFPNTELTKTGKVLDFNYDHYRFGAPLMETDELSASDIINYANTFNKRIKRDKVLNILKDWRTTKWALQRVLDYRR